MERIFIGIKVLPKPGIRRFEELIKERLWKDEIRWVREENFHLTLKFIGNTTLEKRSSVIEELSKNIDSQSPFKMDIKGAGLFGTDTNPKIIWVGVENTGFLTDLWQKVELSAINAGFEKEERPFRPHITLGRIKKINNAINLRSIIKKYENEYFHTQRIKEVILYRSITKHGELFYEPIKKFTFKVW